MELLPFISISLPSQDCTEAVDRTRWWLLVAPCTQIRYALQRDERPQYRDRIQQSTSHITTVPSQLPKPFLINVLGHPYSMALRRCQPTPPPPSSKPKFRKRPRLPSDSSKML